MKVTRYDNGKIPRGVFYRAVHPLSTTLVAPFRKDIDNVVSGMKERVFFLDECGTTVPACKRLAKDLCGLVDSVVSACPVPSRATGSQFLATRTGSKRKMYERAREDLVRKPRSLGNLARLSFFTKWESTVHTKKQVPRIVSPRSFEFNYLLGKFIRPVEHDIFTALGSLFGGGVVVAKGLTQQEKGELIAQKLVGRVAVGLDASRFDQTIRDTLLKVEHSLYTKLYNGDRLLTSLLKCQLTNVGTARCVNGKLTANIGAMRCSGDQNTSLGNCIISCLLARLYFDEHGIDGDVLNDGDDLIMFVPEQSLPLLTDLEEWYSQWGLRMKIEEPAREPEGVEFCQSRPVWTPGGYVLIRNPRKAFNTDYCGAAKVSHLENYLVHLRNVGICGLSMAAGIPLYQEFYGAGIKFGKTGKFDKSELGGVYYQAKLQWRAGHLSRALPIDTMTRVSFEKAFGIPAHTQLDIEGWFKAAIFSGCPIDSANLQVNIFNSLAINCLQQN